MIQITSCLPARLGPLLLTTPTSMLLQCLTKPLKRIAIHEFQLIFHAPTFEP